MWVGLPAQCLGAHLLGRGGGGEAVVLPCQTAGALGCGWQNPHSSAWELQPDMVLGAESFPAADGGEITLFMSFIHSLINRKHTGSS